MTKANTVALITATGLLGAEIFSVLAVLHSAGKLKLVVVHRPSSKLPRLPEGVKARPLDLNTASEADVRAALNSVDVVINASKKTDPASDLAFLSHLASVPTLKRYIPSDFSLNYSASEFAASGSPLKEGKMAAAERARALGIPITVVRNGIFEQFLFTLFTGVSLPINERGRMVLYRDAARNQLPVTSVPYLSKALGEMAVMDPRELGESYTVVEYSCTGDEIARVVKDVTGQDLEVAEWTEQDAEDARRAGDPDALAETVRSKWGKTGWGEEKDAFNPAGPRRSLRDAVVDAVIAPCK